VHWRQPALCYEPAVSRPTVSVIVPFLGSAEEAAEVLAHLASLDARAGDELIVADNTESGLVATIAGPNVTVIAAGDVRSASHARNAGAAAASGEWLLFLDADCLPPPDLLDAYFREPPDDGVGVVAGEIEGVPDQPASLARWARTRRGKWVEHHLSWGPYPAGVTANLLIRRSAFEALDGFRIGGGGDVDLSWRAQEQGWGFLYRPDVVVRHRDRERLGELANQAVAYGGHQRHLRDLHGPAVPRPVIVAPLARSLAGGVVFAVSGQFERARFKLIDGLWSALVWSGWLTKGARARKAD
jgi:GT2 family glycosyltransferase